MLHGSPADPEQLKLGIDSSSPGFPDIFVRYKELRHLRGELYSHATEGYLDPYYLDKIDDLMQVNKFMPNIT